MGFNAMSKEMDLIVTDLIDWYDNFDGNAPILKRAADAIEDLRVENERLRAALEKIGSSRVGTAVGDFARAALESKQ